MNQISYKNSNDNIIFFRYMEKINENESILNLTLSLRNARHGRHEDQ